MREKITQLTFGVLAPQGVLRNPLAIFLELKRLATNQTVLI
jgi:hypothetical protein